MIKHILACGTMLMLMSFAPESSAGFSAAWPPGEVIVTTCTQIIGGGTIEVAMDGYNKVVVLAGIEIIPPQKINGEMRWMNIESQQVLNGLVLKKKVYVELTKYYDSSGFQLAWVWTGDADKLSVQAEVTRCGYARATIATPVKYLRVVIDAEKEARLLKAGYWAGSQ